MNTQQLDATQYVEGGGRAGQLYQEIECLDCGEEWTDTYELSGFFVKEQA